ncbi:MAG: DUF3141 domain-containing protein [Geminicoccaceae bacterium]
MSKTGTDATAGVLQAWGAGLAAEAMAYAIDAAQRTVLFADIMRQRGNQYREYVEGRAKPVLSYDYEFVMLGRDLPRPVNYALVRIKAPEGVATDESRRPFIVVDPRAGHGPGIGGFKADSEIGMALRAGHPCYFIGFGPEPLPGQTILDIAHAEATFVERVIELHPGADGKPAVIGNCQAGWAVMIVAALRPELFGPIIVAGAPLSYWNGVHGANPMRYAGGLQGGSWLAELVADLGAGKFDGAWLVSNFEKLNPANTWWEKQYNVWARADTEAERYLGFERWWGGHVNLNAEEIQYIVDNLFVGNKLATAELVSDDGVRIDLRGIRSPIVCFCSHGDNITPPQQALGWITDLYGSVQDIRAHGQTIVYCVHDTIGHLGIFVSASVARKEHGEFASNIDFIDVLPPGLYEAVIVPKAADATNPDLAGGDYILRFEARDLDDIRKLGGNDEEDERRFATVARVSEINHGLYRTFLQPWVRAVANPALAQWLGKLHPARLSFELFSDANPLLAPLAQVAERVRADRQPVAEDNPFLKLQHQVNAAMVEMLTAWGDARDKLQEDLFLAVYGSPLLQAAVGLRADDGPVRRRPGDEPEHRAFVAAELDRIRASADVGDVRRAAIRAMVYVGAPQRAADERSFNMLRQIQQAYGGTMTLAEFKDVLRDELALITLDPRAAIDGIPTMLAKDPAQVPRALDALRRVIGASGRHGEEGLRRLAEMERIFEAALPAPAAAEPAPAPAAAPAETPKPARRAAPRRPGTPRRAGGSGRGKATP